jgi:hypothetical protein
MEGFLSEVKRKVRAGSEGLVSMVCRTADRASRIEQKFQEFKENVVSREGIVYVGEAEVRNLRLLRSQP